MLTRFRWPLIAIVMVILAIGLFPSNPPETPLQRTYRICKACGLYEHEIDLIIEQVRSSGLTPKESIQLWKDTVEPGAVEMCRDCVDCVDAVVRVVGSCSICTAFDLIWGFLLGNRGRLRLYNDPRR